MHAADAETHRLAYVEKLTAPTTAIAGQPVSVALYGHLPNPNWQLGEIRMARADHLITLSPWTDLVKRGMVVQMLVPFARTIPIGALTPGTWTIRALGYGRTQAEAHIQVLPAQAPPDEASPASQP